jgi:predicted ATPase/class 3 adenylate cyclase
LDHHHRVLRDAWRRHEGYEFFTEGDAFGVAFASVDQALAACLDAQWHLQNEPWPNGIRMPVRMGVHTGLAAPRDGDYIALAVHQTSRVVAAAHGDQIVVTADALASAGPEFRASACDLGRYRVRDFEDPVHLHEVSDSGLTSTFPALRVPPARLHNLARPAASFIGRDNDMARLEQLVEPGRVVSIVGPGGVGKTRLCTEFAFRAVDRWPDGVWFVDLAALDQGDLVVSATATALGIAPSETDTLTALLDHLSSRSALLVFDNAEHVLEHTAHLASRVTGHSPATALLVTSREPIGLRGERLMRLQPLRANHAALLFIDRSRDLASDSIPDRSFDIDDERVLELCNRLDCLPLALEMAAARTEVFTVEEILRGLDAQSYNLRIPDPSVAPRQRSIGHLVDWSVQLLDPHCREALGRASCFAAGFTPAGLHALFDGHGPLIQIDDALHELTRKSLFVAVNTDGERRYRLLETVRAHVRSQRSADELHRDVAALGRWLVESLGPTTQRNQQWAHAATAELPNIRHAARVLAGSDADLAAQLVAIIAGLHDLKGSVSVGLDELHAFETLFDRRHAARVHLLTNLAWLHLVSGRLDEAETSLAEATELCSTIEVDEERRMEVAVNGAELELRLGRPAKALDALDPLLSRQLPSPLHWQTWTLASIVRIALGDLSGAAEARRNVVRAAAEQGETALLAPALSNLADIYLSLNEVALAASTQIAALERDEQMGSVKQLPFSMMLAALIAGRSELWEDALWLQARADRLLDSLGVALYPVDRIRGDRLLAEATAALGDGHAARIVSQASHATISEILDRTKSVLNAMAEPKPERSSPSGGTS